MKKAIILIVFFQVFCPYMINAQTVFSKFYDIENRSDYGMEIKHHKGNYYIYGKGGQYDSLTNYEYGHEYLAVIDSVTLELKNVFFFKESIFANIGNVMEIENDTIYVFATDRILPAFKWDVYKFNLQGDSITVLEYDIYDYDKAFAKSIRIKDGYLYLSGQSSTRISDMIFIKSDKKGKVIKKERFFDFIVSERRKGYGYFNKTSDGDFIFDYGYILKEDIGQYYEYVYYFDLLKFDRNLNVLWKKNMVRVKDGTFFNGMTSKLTPTLDSGFYASVIIPFGDSLWLDKYINRNIADWPIIFYKYNSEGNIEWTDTMFNYKYPDWTFPRKYVTHIKTLNNGDMVGSGYVEEPVYPPASSFRGWLFSYSKEGHLKWQHYYQYNGQDTTYIDDVVECGNGDFLCVGEIILKNEPDKYNRRRTWLFRVDSNGCYIPGCVLDSLTAVYTSVEDVQYPPVVNILNLYPNPVSDYISIEIPENYAVKDKISWEIYNITGKKVKTGTHLPLNHRLDISGLQDLDTGRYFIVLINKNRFLGVGKFIKK